MYDHYEINVSINGVHFFATAPRSCVDDFEAARALREIRDRFPASDGFSVTISKWTGTGHELDDSEIKRLLGYL